MLRYSQEWDLLLDPMIWGGTTAVECKLLNRHLLAYDINPNALEITKKALDFKSEHKPKIELKLNDTRVLNFLKNESIDFILTHPPYSDIIQYSEWKIEKEYFRVLKKWKFCAILMGDTRRNKLYQPMAFKVMDKFLKAWFLLKEDIVKVQHNCKATWFRVKKSKEANFLLIMHEHLFIFQKI